MKTTWVALTLGKANPRVLLVGNAGESEATVRRNACESLSARDWASVFVTTKTECVRYYLTAWNNFQGAIFEPRGPRLVK